MPLSADFWGELQKAVTGDSEKPSLAVCSNSCWRCSQSLLPASPENAELSEVGAVTVPSRFTPHGRPRSQRELDVSLTVTPRATGVCGERAGLASSQGRAGTAYLRCGWYTSEASGTWTSLWGEALNFSFSGESCLTKYKLPNHMCNQLLQKLPRLQFPAKREEPAFTDTGSQAQAVVGILCPLLHFASHFYYFILDLDWQYWCLKPEASISLEWSVDSVPQCCFLPAGPPWQHSICKC